jgi:hypothetical protein
MGATADDPGAGQQPHDGLPVTHWLNLDIDPIA